MQKPFRSAAGCSWGTSGRVLGAAAMVSPAPVFLKVTRALSPSIFRESKVGPEVDDVFSVGHAPGGKGEAMTDVVLVFGVNVLALSDIDDHGLARPGELEGHRLGFAQSRPPAGGLRGLGAAIHEIGKLHPDEREVPFVPAGAPVGDHRGEERLIFSGLPAFDSPWYQMAPLMA